MTPPHVTSRRPYGYARDGVTIIEHEAQIVRGIFARYLDGASHHQIAQDLTERGERTATGKQWQSYSVREMLKSRHVTGIRVFRGQDFGDGDWPVIIDRGTGTEVQDRLTYRASAHARRPCRFYVLRGVVMCKKCGIPMAGCMGKDPSYVCAQHDSIGPARCTRRINAAVELLTRLDVTGVPTAATALSAAEEATMATDEQELAELRAEAISPYHLHRNPMVRDVLAELVSRARHDAVGRELRGMAYQAGLPV